MGTSAEPSPRADDALSPLQEQGLWQEFNRRRDAVARNRLIEHYLPLATSIAGALFAHRGPLAVEFIDYVQLATLGLIESVDRFDSSRGVPFAGYASHRIRGSVLNALESLSETYQQNALRNRLRADRIESLRRRSGSGKADPFAELADVAVGFALGYLLEGSRIVAPDKRHGDAYEQPFYRGVEQRQLTQTLARLVAALPDQERRVIRYHYYQGLPFQEIAELFGVSKGRISQIHRQALQLLREARDVAGDLSISL